jgi:hypothetical protein
MKEKTDLFSSRYFFLFAAIGMAIGAGNICKLKPGYLLESVWVIRNWNLFISVDYCNLDWYSIQ